jgi:hypothetical protein
LRVWCRYSYLVHGKSVLVRVYTREKGVGAIWESTGGNTSLVLLMYYITIKNKILYLPSCTVAYMLHVHRYICTTIKGLLMIKTLSHCPVGHLLCFFLYSSMVVFTLIAVPRHCMGFCRLRPSKVFRIWLVIWLAIWLFKTFFVLRFIIDFPNSCEYESQKI